MLAGALGGFLPVLGYWLIPLGLIMLSIDLPFLKHPRRRFMIWWNRRFKNFKIHLVKQGR